jgi:hypothetical protein
LKNVDAGRPSQATFVAFSGFVGQHCNENVVWMDSAAFDVLCVCEAVEDVFRVLLGGPLGVPPPYDGMQLAVGDGGCVVGVPPPYDGFRLVVLVGVPPPYDGMQLAVDVFWVDDSDFCSGEFAKIADECSQGHSFAFSIDSFARE